jgi:LCP family protein required for cell wall assembly
MAHFAAVPDNESHRRWVRRVVIGINIVLGVTLIAALSAVGYALFLYSKLDRLSLGLGGRSVSQPINVLIVGSDSRQALSKSDRKSFGTSVGGQRSDTIMLAHLNPDTKSITLVSFPRDLWVPIAGSSHSAKINSAFESGKNSTEGAKTLIDTIENNWDVRIDHYVEVDFDGFRSIVNTLGGVNVYFDYPARDVHSGLYQTTAGCVNVFGDEALAYARSRYFQQKINGSWHSDPTSDIGRISRQQDFMKRVAAKAVRKAKGSPFTTEKLVRHGIKYVKIDDGFGVSDLIKLAQKYKKVDPNTIQAMGAVPGTLGRQSGQSVIIPNFDAADAMLSVFRSNGGSASDVTSTSNNGTFGTQVPSIPPNEVHVKVLNGSGVNKQAEDVANKLKEQGFATAGFGPADTFAYTKTVIRYNTGEQAKALMLQHLVKGASVLQQSDVAGADVVIITGTSFSGLDQVSTTTSTTKGSSASSTTATTVNSSRSVGGNATNRPSVGSPSVRQCVA